MEDRPYTGFYARFLGGFSLRYGGREIKVHANLQKRSTQFLLLLLRAGAKGVERKELLALIRPTEKEQKKRLNNFYQQMHILRDMVPRMGLPEGDFIVLQGVRYYFSLDYEIKTDIGYLDELVEQSRRDGLEEQERRAIYMEYCKSYRGEFLPMLAGEEWVTMESAFYQKWYIRCLNSLCTYLKKEGQYGTMLELCTKASQIHPYDEWQAKQIECLMAMGRYKEAMEIYEEAREIFYKGLGVTSLDQVVAKYRHREEPAVYGTDSLAEMKLGLAEEGADSPYCCSFPSFQDAYRIIVRMGERKEAKSLLLLCTLREPLRVEDAGRRNEEGDGTAAGRIEGGQTAAGVAETRQAADRKAWEQRMLRLKQVLTGGLRACDVYTRYSEDQYLALLIGAGMEDGERIAARLERAWKLEVKDRRIRLEITIQEAGESGMGEWRDGEEDIRCACRQPGERYLAGAGHMAG